MSKFAVGDIAYVPTTLLKIERPHALTERKVLQVSNRSITVDTVGGDTTTVASARAHCAPLGFLIINIGDLGTATDLQLLAESIDAYFRLLLPGDLMKRIDLRTLAELEHVWRAEHGGTSHVVLAGHGSEDGLPFLDREQLVLGSQLAEILGAASPHTAERPRQFMSLCCETGRRKVAGQLSKTKLCGDFVGPFQKIHAAAAAHFCQTYFASLLLEGRVSKHAFRKAQLAVRGDAKFRLWRDGKVAKGT